MNKHRFPMIALIITLVVVFPSFSEASMEVKTRFKSISEVPAERWTALSEKSLFFGHQSVGYNILDGIKALMAARPELKLELVETRDANKIKAGVFAHTQIGKNQDPLFKVKDFADVMDKEAGNQADYAYLKFCYVDITGDSDIQQLFDAYKKNIEILQKRYSKTTFIHFTVPLTTVSVNWKTKLKKLLGMDLWEYRNIIKRNEYNQMVLEEYHGKAPVFDIAAIESTRPDGKREYVELDNKKYYTLVREYTSDGGHLNDLGKSKVAEQLLLFLANLI